MNSVVSIIICTRNRAEHLRLTLESLADLRLPASLNGELIVVDNASTDSTPAVVQCCSLPQMPVRYVCQPEPGLSRSRNRGLIEAAGDIILFTDDDIRPPTDWVEAMCEPILSGKADAVAGGVHMAPHLEKPWMELPHHILVASNTWWQPATQATLVGANMAFSRRVLSLVPGFDVELGAGALGSYDDYLFSQQIERAGFRVATVLPASVEHHFQPDRLQSAAMIRTAEGLGRSLAYIAHHWKHEPAPNPYGAWARTMLRLQFYRARHFLQTRGRKADYLPGWEVQQVQDVAFAAQMLRERRRPRCYAKFGLSPLTPNSKGQDA